MSVRKPSFNSKEQVPNDPFSASEEWSLKTAQGSLIADEGITVDAGEGTISAEGTGVLINTANGICGGPITKEGTITLCHSGVIPGTYAYHDLTVDVYGRVVDAAPGAPASSEIPGVLRIAEFAEVATGTDNTAAVTPAGLTSIKSSSITSDSQSSVATAFAVKRVHDLVCDLSSTIIPNTAFTEKGQVLVATGTESYIALPVGTEGQILKVCSACPSGISWHTDQTGGSDIPCSTFTAAGQIIASTGASQFIALDSGADGEVLIACSACSSGLTWVGASATPSATPTTLGTVYGLTDTTTLTALGYCALATSPPNISNTAVGHLSTKSITTGCRNTAIGSISLTNTTNGVCNVAVGYGSLDFNSNGSGNTAVGTCSLRFSNGSCNTSIGYLSGQAITSGSFNTFIGPFAGSGINIGSNNVAIGNLPQLANTCCHIIIGTAGTIRLQINDCGALSFNGTDYGTSGYFLKTQGSGSAPVWSPVSTIIPSATPQAEGAVYGCTTPQGTTSLGVDTLSGVTVGLNNTAIGHRAMNTSTGNSNVAVGMDALSVSTGDDNVAVGFEALCKNDSLYNTAVGRSAACNNIDGLALTAVGYGALGSNTYANANTAVGSEALASNIGSSQDLWLQAENTAVGYRSHFGGSGRWNTAVGSRSLEGNVSGVCQVAMGVCALALATNSFENVAIGVCSLYNSQGTQGTAIGYRSGRNLVSGGNNVFLGALSGTDALCTLVSGSDHVILGNNSTTTILQKVASTIGSDVRYKKVHGEVPLALPFVQNLETIKYQWCDSETGEVTDDRYRYGFSAQNVIENEEDPEHPIIGSNANPDMLTLSPTDMIPVLVNAIKELSSKMDSMQAELDRLAG